MLNFLNTAVLAVAAAALLPFLLHLFSKRKVKVIPFSSIVFLKAMQKRQVRAIKIKQLLLLIIRMLIILIVVFAFARPATKGGYIGSHASVSAVILIDNSASMGLSVKDGRLMDLALRKAREILNQMGQADEAAVITVSGSEGQSGNAVSGGEYFGNPAAALTSLDDISITDGRADLKASINNVIKILAERDNLNREIYIISDFQENSFNLEETLAPLEGKIFLVELPSNQIENSSIIDVDFGNQLIEVGTEFTVSTTIKRRAGEGVGDMLVSINLDGSRVAQQDLRLKTGESRSLPFTLMVTKSGFHSGFVAISDDDLVADNIYHFSFYIPDQFTVLIAGDEATDSRLIRLALAPEENLRRHWSVQRVSYAKLASVNLNEYDVLILANYSSLPRGDIARIREFVDRGRGLFVNLGRAVDTAHYNGSISGLTGIRLTSGFPKTISRTGHYLLSDFDMSHQILSVFKTEHTDKAIGFKSFARLKSSVLNEYEPQILARWSDGSPAITVSSHGRGRVMFFNCDLSPDISDISLHPFFVPFMIRSVEYLSSDFSTHSETIYSGDTQTRPLRFGFNIRNEYMLESPDRSRRMVTGEFVNDVHNVACGRLDESGVYSIWNDLRESDRFAVNIDPEEGDLYRIGWTDLSSRLRGAEKMPYGVDLAGFISEKRFGRELWQYFLAAALFLLLLEMYIARDRGGLPNSDE